MTPARSLLPWIALVALAPLASAQLSPLTDTTMQVAIEPFEGAITPGATHWTPGKLTWTGTGFAGLSQQIPVKLRVEEAPEWATVAVSPSDMVLTHGTTAQVVTMTADFRVMVALKNGAPAGETALVKVRACSENTGFAEASCGEDSTIITTPASAAASPASAREESAEAPGVEVASTEAEAQEPASLAVSAGALGLGGALLGLVARVAWVRQKR